MSKISSRWYYSALLLAAVASSARAQTIDKAFSVFQMALNHSTTMTFTIASGGGTLNFGFTDLIPQGLTVTSMVSNNCGGTFTPLPVVGGTGPSPANTLIYTGGSTSTTCQVAFKVLGTFVGLKGNTVVGTDGLAGTGDGAILNVVAPTFTKSFSGPIITPPFPTMPLNGTTTLTFTLQNGSPDALSPVGWHDELPNGMQVLASLPNTCGGTSLVTANGNHDVIDVSGVSLAAGANCSVAYLVIATAATPPGNPASNQATGTGDLLTLNPTASINIKQPDFTKTFLSHSIKIYESTVMTIHIGNDTGTPLTHVGFTDPMPNNLEVTSLVSSACTDLSNLAVTITPSAPPAPSAVSVTDATIPNGVSCDVKVNVQAIAPPPPAPPLLGAGGTITRFNLATGTGDLDGLHAADTIDVSFPSFTKTVNPPTINSGGITTFTITVNNVTAVPFSNLQFSDTLPVQLTLVGGSVVNNCPGGTSVPLPNGFSIPPFALNAGVMCTITFQATGPVVGAPISYRNTATGAGDLLNFNPFADVLVTPPPTFTKTFGPGPIAVDVPTTLTFNIGNQTAGPLANVGFTDILPLGLAYVSTATNTCVSGTLNINPAQPVSVTLSGVTLPSPGSCQIVLNLKTTTAGLKDNTANGTGSLLTINPNAQITVLAPTFTKAFNPPSILLTQTSTLTLTVNNTTAIALPAFGFSDSLAALGLTAPNSGPTAACGGNVSVLANVITLTGGTLIAGGNCSIPIVVTPTSVGSKLNTATGSGNLLGLNPTATLTVGTPEFSKSFNPPSILSGQTSTLTLLVNNPTNIPLPSFGFTDDLGTIGLTAANVAATAACGGTYTVTGNLVSLVGGTLAAGTNCQIQIVVTPVGAGLKNNIAHGSGDLAGKDPTATLTVGAPSFTKAFAPTSILLSQTSTLTLSVMNPTALTLNFGFSDNLAAIGLSAPNSAPTAACGGNVSVTANVITLTGGTLAPSANCSIPIVVTPTTTGVNKLNTATGSGDLLGINPTAMITVGTPEFTKSFNPPSIITTQTSVLTLTINNPTTVPLTNFGFVDNLAAIGLSAPNTAATAACGGSYTIAGNIVTLTGGTLAATTSCNIQVTVTPVTSGNKVNTATGSGDLLGKNPTANLNVFELGFSKAFVPSTILLTQTSTLTFSLANPSASALATLGFTDDLASIGLSAPNTAATAACGGSYTVAANIITLTGGTLAAGGNCTFNVVVTPTSAGTKNNIATGTGTLAGRNATATLTVQTPGFSKSFAPPSILTGQTSTLTLLINNTTGVALANFGFTDNLPVGLTATNSGPTAACGGSYTVAANIITLTGGTLAAGGSCSVAVVVTGVTDGSKNNLANGSGDLLNKSAAATLVVTPKGDILFSKAFSAGSVPINTNVNLTFTMTNNSGATATQLGFTDNLPSGLTVVAQVSNSCGGTLIATPGATSITLTNGNLPNTLSCTVVITVKSSSAGTKDNLAVGQGDLTGKNAPATILITQPVFSKVFSPNSTTVGSIVKLTFTIPNNTAAPIVVGFADPLITGQISGIEVASPLNFSLTGCGAAIFTPVVGATSLTLSNATIAAFGSCVVTIDLVNTTAGSKHNVATGTGAIQGQLAEADLDVFDAPSDAFQIRYFSNLNIGESYINITNYGGSSTVGLPTQNGNLCVNTYTYSPDEQLISCCSCNVTPNGLNSLQVKADLASNTMTALLPSSVVVKLLATRQNGSCNPATVVRGDLRAGLAAWGSTLHAAPATGGTPPGTFNMTETPFSRSTLSDAELFRMTQLCAYIQANGSGYGICKSCRVGGLGASAK